MPDSETAPLLLIVNRSAGRGKAVSTLRRTTALLDRARYPFRVEPSSSGEHAGELAQLGCEAGELPVAVGGDGQVARVAEPLIGTGQTMGVIPCGRGNDLARGLGIPTDPEAALGTIFEGASRTLDTGVVDGSPFLGIASVGFDSKANEIANRTGFLPGKSVYAWSAVRALMGWKPVRFSVVADGVERRVEAHTVAVANNRFYGAGMMMAPDARLDDGMLDLVIVGAVSRMRFIADFPRVFSGKHVDGVRVTSEPVREVELKCGSPLTVYADGDPIAELPARLRVRPRSLSILAPAPKAGP